MGLQRIVLWIFAIGFGVFGLASLLAPASVAGLVAIGFEAPMAATDFRAIYGGIEIGLAAFLLLAATRDDLRGAGLLAGTLVFTGIAGSRLLGLVLDASWNGPMLAALGMELAGAVLGGIALSRSK